MSGYLPFQFIEEKVKDLENALFFSMSDAVLKIPACVVKVLENRRTGTIMVYDSETATVHSCIR